MNFLLFSRTFELTSSGQPKNLLPVSGPSQAVLRFGVRPCLQVSLVPSSSPQYSESSMYIGTSMHRPWRYSYKHEIGEEKKLKNRWKVLVFSFTLTAPSAIAASLFCTFLLVTMAVICGVRMRLMDALVWPATSYNRSSIYGRVLNEVVGWFASPTINTRIYYYPTWHYKKMKL